MAGKRKIISSILDSFGLMYLFGVLKRKQKNKLTIITYHRIINPGDAGTYNREVVSASPLEFEKQMEFINKNFTAIDFFDLRDILDKKKEVPSNPVIITFDDGYRDNYEHAFPVLKKFNLKAVIFLATGFIGTDKMFWWDEISSILQQSGPGQLSLPSFEGEKINIPEQPQRGDFIEGFLKKIKQMPNNRKELVLKELRESSVIDKESQKSVMMSWDMAREMRENGIELGAHTVNHPVLSKLEPSLVKEEIKSSLEEIEQKTGVKPISFCYPVGKRESFNKNIGREVMNNGFLFAVTLLHGLNHIDTMENFYLNRLNIHYNDSFAEYKAKILLPDIIKY